MKLLVFLCLALSALAQTYQTLPTTTVTGKDCVTYYYQTTITGQFPKSKTITISAQSGSGTARVTMSTRTDPTLVAGGLPDADQVSNALCTATTTLVGNSGTQSRDIVLPCMATADTTLYLTVTLSGDLDFIFTQTTNAPSVTALTAGKQKITLGSTEQYYSFVLPQTGENIVAGTQLIFDINPYSTVDYTISGSSVATSSCNQLSGTFPLAGVQLNDCFLKAVSGGKVYITLTGSGDFDFRVQWITPTSLLLDQPVVGGIAYPLSNYYSLSLASKDTNSYVVISISDVVGSPLNPTSTVTLSVRDLDTTDGCSDEYTCSPQQTGCVIKIDPCVTSTNYLIRVRTSSATAGAYATFVLSASYVTPQAKPWPGKKYPGSILPGNVTVFNWAHGLADTPGSHLVVYLYLDDADPKTGLSLSLRDPKKDLCTSTVQSCVATSGACALILNDVDLSYLSSPLYIQVEGVPGASHFSLDPIYYTLEVSTYTDYPLLNLDGETEPFTISYNPGYMAFKLPPWNSGTLLLFATATTPINSAVNSVRLVAVPGKLTRSPPPAGTQVSANYNIPNVAGNAFLAVPFCQKYKSMNLYLVIEVSDSDPLTFNQLTFATKQYTTKDSNYQLVTGNVNFVNPTVKKITPSLTVQREFLENGDEDLNDDYQTPVVQGQFYYYYYRLAGLSSDPGTILLETRTAKANVQINVYNAPASYNDPSCYINNPLETPLQVSRTTGSNTAVSRGIHIPYCALSSAEGMIVEVITSGLYSAEFTYQAIPLGNTFIDVAPMTSGTHLKYGYAQDVFPTGVTRRYQFSVTQEDINKNRVFNVHAYIDTAKYSNHPLVITVLKPGNVGGSVAPDCQCSDASISSVNSVTYTLNACDLVVGTYTIGITQGDSTNILVTAKDDLQPEVTIEITVDETLVDLNVDSSMEVSLRDRQVKIFKFTVDSSSDIFVLSGYVEQSDANIDSPALFYSLSTFPYLDCQGCSSQLPSGYSSTTGGYSTNFYPCGSSSKTYYLHVYTTSGTSKLHNFIIRFKKSVVVPVTLPAVDTTTDCSTRTDLVLENPETFYSVNLATVDRKALVYHLIANQYDSVEVIGLNEATCSSQIVSDYTALNCATKLYFRSINMYTTLTYSLCRLPTLAGTVSVPVTSQPVRYYVKGNARQPGGVLKTQIVIDGSNTVAVSAIPVSTDCPSCPSPSYSIYQLICTDTTTLGASTTCTFYLPDVDCNRNVTSGIDHIYTFVSFSGNYAVGVTVSTPSAAITSIPIDGSFLQTTIAPGDMKIFRYTVTQNDLTLGTYWNPLSINSTGTVAPSIYYTSALNNPVVPYGDILAPTSTCNSQSAPGTVTCYGSVQDYYVTVVNTDPSTASPSTLYLGVDKVLIYKNVNVPAFTAGVTSATSTSDKDVFVLDVPEHSDGQIFRVYLTPTTDAAVTTNFMYSSTGIPLVACGGPGLTTQSFQKNIKTMILEETCPSPYPRKLYVAVSSAGVKLDAELVAPTLLIFGNQASLSLPVTDVAPSEYRSILVKVTGIPTKSSLSITFTSAPQSYTWGYYVGISSSDPPPYGLVGTDICSTSSGSFFNDGTYEISEQQLCALTENGYLYILATATNTGTTSPGGATISVVASQNSRFTADLPATLNTVLPDSTTYILPQTIAKDKYLQMTLSTVDALGYNARVNLARTPCGGNTRIANLAVSNDPTLPRHTFLLPCDDTPHDSFLFSSSNGQPHNLTVVTSLQDITYTEINPNHQVGVRAALNKPVFFRHLPVSDNTDPINKYTGLSITMGSSACPGSYIYTLSSVEPVSTNCLSGISFTGSISAGQTVSQSLTDMADGQPIYNSLGVFYLTLIPSSSSPTTYDDVKFTVHLTTDEATSPLPVVQNIRDREVVDLAFSLDHTTSAAGLCDTANSVPSCCKPNPIQLKSIFVYDLQGSNLLDDIRFNVEITNPALVSSMSVVYEIPGQSTTPIATAPYSVIIGSCPTQLDSLQTITVSSSTVQVIATIIATPNPNVLWEKIDQTNGNWNFARVYVDAEAPQFFPVALSDRPNSYKDMTVVIKPYQTALFQIALPDDLPDYSKSVRVTYISVQGGMLLYGRSTKGSWDGCPQDGTVSICSSESLLPNNDAPESNPSCKNYCEFHEIDLCDTEDNLPGVLRYYVKSAGDIVTLKIRFALDVLSPVALPSCKHVDSMRFSLSTSHYYNIPRNTYKSSFASLGEDEVYRVNIRANLPESSFQLSLFDFTDSGSRNCDTYAKFCTGECSVIYRGSALPVIRFEPYSLGYYNITEYIETPTVKDLGFGVTHYPSDFTTGCYDYSGYYYRIPQSLMDNGQKLRLALSVPTGNVALYDQIPQNLMGYGQQPDIAQFRALATMTGNNEVILPYRCNGTQDYYLWLAGTSSTTLTLENISPVESTLTAGSLTNLPSSLHQTFTLTANNAGPLDTLTITTSSLPGNPQFWLSGTSGYSSDYCNRATGLSYESCLLQEDEKIYVNSFILNPSPYPATYSYASYSYSPNTVVSSSTLPVRVTGGTQVNVQFDLTGITSDSLIVLTTKPSTTTSTFDVSEYQSLSLHKGRLNPGASACSRTCSSNGDAATPFSHLNSVQLNRIKLFGPCFHCGGAYNTFVVSAVANSAYKNVDVHPSLQVLNPNDITDAAISIGNTTDGGEGVYLFKFDQDYTSPSDVVITVSSGALNVGYYGQTGASFDSSASVGCTPQTGVRYKVCVADVPCKLGGTSVGEHFYYGRAGYSKTIYAVVVGTATFSISRSSQSCVVAPSTHNNPNITFCSGVDLSSSILPYESAQAADEYASATADYLVGQVTTELGVNNVHNNCKKAITNYACNVAFRKCSVLTKLGDSSKADGLCDLVQEKCLSFVSGKLSCTKPYTPTVLLSQGDVVMPSIWVILLFIIFVFHY